MVTILGQFNPRSDPHISSPPATGVVEYLSRDNIARNKMNRGVVPLISGATINTNGSLSNVFTLALQHNAVLSNPSNLLPGATYMWIITQGGGFTLSYGSVFSWMGLAPSISASAGVVDIISGVYDGTKLRVAMNKGFV